MAIETPPYGRVGSPARDHGYPEPDHPHDADRATANTRPRSRRSTRKMSWTIAGGVLDRLEADVDHGDRSAFVEGAIAAALDARAATLGTGEDAPYVRLAKVGVHLHAVAEQLLAIAGADLRQRSRAHP